MSNNLHYSIREDSAFKEIVKLIIRNYKFFLGSIFVTFSLAFTFNKYAIPKYRVASSIMIQPDSRPSPRLDINDYLNSNLFNNSNNFQNEIWILKSSTIIERTIKDLQLYIKYSIKNGFLYKDGYDEIPIKVSIARQHVQPMNVRFNIAIIDNKNFNLYAKTKKVQIKSIYGTNSEYKTNWNYSIKGRFGEIIETDDLAFVVSLDSSKKYFFKDSFIYGFQISDIRTQTDYYKKNLEFNSYEDDATIVEISIKTQCVKEGIDIVNNIMNNYSNQNLERKNHIAKTTIDYIEKQLDDISDSLIIAENNLQRFRSSNQLLNITDQETAITSQYNELQNLLAEKIMQKKYYNYVTDFLDKNKDFTEIIVPASIGIQDQLLNNLMIQMTTAQNQLTALIQNKQERNPLVIKLTNQVESYRKTISDNISTLSMTVDITIEDINSRILKLENQISRIPQTQIQLGGIERRYKLNDAIYNYLLEKRAEAKITQASNLPNDVVLQAADLVGNEPILPNKGGNYLIAAFIGFVFPLAFISIKNLLNNKINSQQNLEKLTDIPIVGKIMHNNKKTNNILLVHPQSSISESFRTLRTRIETLNRNNSHKIFMITSCIEGEGKSFIALNLAMSYAQLNVKTLLINFDLRKPSVYFNDEENDIDGLTAYYIDKKNPEEIILKSPHQKLDYIPSGIVSPNPTELITPEKTQNLFNILGEKYECIILDTSPLAQVSDAYILMYHVNVLLMIVRYHYSLKDVVEFIIKDLEKHIETNMFIVLNDNHILKDQYGYGYGYKKK